MTPAVPQSRDPITEIDLSLQILGQLLTRLIEDSISDERITEQLFTAKHHINQARKSLDRTNGDACSCLRAAGNNGSFCH